MSGALVESSGRAVAQADAIGYSTFEQIMCPGEVVATIYTMADVTAGFGEIADVSAEIAIAGGASGDPNTMGRVI